MRGHITDTSNLCSHMNIQIYTELYNSNEICEQGVKVKRMIVPHSRQPYDLDIDRADGVCSVTEDFGTP